MATVVNVKADRFDVYVGRTCGEYEDIGFGNHYVVGKDGDVETCVAMYRAHLRANPDLMARRSELQGKVLGCWCMPCKPSMCHGFALCELANTGKVSRRGNYLHQ